MSTVETIRHDKGDTNLKNPNVEKCPVCNANIKLEPVILEGLLDRGLSNEEKWKIAKYGAYYGHCKGCSDGLLFTIDDFLIIEKRVSDGGFWQSYFGLPEKVMLT